MQQIAVAQEGIARYSITCHLFPLAYFVFCSTIALTSQVGQYLKLEAAITIISGENGSMSNSPTSTSRLPPRTANDFIEQQLDDRILEIEGRHGADAISFCGPIVFGVDDILRIAVEKKHKQRPRRNKLVILLTTLGGYIEVVQRMVDILRSHYKLVDFVIPNYAYSAGTVLAMSGDAIYMDYYSRLGPIDPQVESQTGRPVPALGYLERYNELLKKANTGTISTAEVQILLQFDQAELYQYEQARELSITLLKQWLVKYKFKNWKKTETRRLKVTKQIKTDRADQ